jgi:hypothetical protein
LISVFKGLLNSILLFVLASLPLINITVEAIESVSNSYSCGMHLVYRSREQGKNQLLYQRYAEGQWSGSDLIHSNSVGLSYVATTTSDAEGNLLVVWVEDSGGLSQLMYRVKSLSGKWLTGSRQLTVSKGEKTQPLLIRSISGQVFLIWTSDERGNDDVFFASWKLDIGWSDTQVLSADNVFPDISPMFDYSQNIDSSYDLNVRWNASSGDGIYVQEQVIIETNMALMPEQEFSIEQCTKELAGVVLPVTLRSGFVHLPQLGLNSYQRIRNR